MGQIARTLIKLETYDLNDATPRSLKAVRGVWLVTECHAWSRVPAPEKCDSGKMRFGSPRKGNNVGIYTALLLVVPRQHNRDDYVCIFGGLIMLVMAIGIMLGILGVDFSNVGRKVPDDRPK
jgi:hypothetical protein